MQELDLPQMVREAHSRLRTPVPLCKVCDLPEYNDPDWVGTLTDLGYPFDGKSLAKKGWEYAQLLYGLRRLNCLKSDARALSVGCGSEPHLYYLTNYIAEVVGVDLFEGELADVVKDPGAYARMDYRAERLQLSRMDGRRLAFPDNCFDIVFSLSSIEHFGGHTGAARASYEIGRVLKPGGIAAIATEFILSGANHSDFFSWEDLHKYVIEPSNLELIEPIDTSISSSLGEHYVHVSNVHSSLYMIVYWGTHPNRFPFTSIMLFMIKPQQQLDSAQRSHVPAIWRKEMQELDLPHLIREARSRLRTPVPLCKVCDLPEYNDPDWLSAASALGLPTDGTWVAKKYWEYTHLLYGLRQLNCIQPNARALSVGCGSEPHLFYLTNHIAQVVGIDLFNGELADILEHPEKYTMMPHHLERLQLVRMNGCRLEFPDNSFDFVFSLSSIEHFGGHKAAAQAMREIGRVLKPGGVAAIATEFIPVGVKHPSYFCWADLHQYVIRPSKLQLVGSIDLSISDSLKEHYVHVRDVRSPLYLLVHDGESPHTVPFTSVMLFMVKPQRRADLRQKGVVPTIWDMIRRATGGANVHSDFSLIFPPLASSVLDGIKLVHARGVAFLDGGL